MAVVALVLGRCLSFEPGIPQRCRGKVKFRVHAAAASFLEPVVAARVFSSFMIFTFITSANS